MIYGEKKHSHKKIEILSLCILFIIYLISRLYALDSDIPLWGKSHYSPIDEFYYTTLAFDIVEGAYAPGGRDVGGWFSAYNLIQQLLTAGSLFLFGDNYYGLRISSVFSGFFVFLIFYFILLKRFGLLWAVMLSALLLANFSFILATRISEPTIFRMAAATAFIAFCSVTDRFGTRRAFALGLITGIFWIFVYPTNAFLLLAGLVIVAISHEKRSTANLWNYSVGLIVSGAAYLLCYFILGNDVGSLLAVKDTFSNRVSGLDGGLLKGMLIKLLSVRQAGFFSTHRYFFYTTLVSFVVIMWCALFDRKRLLWVDRVFLVFIICFLLQTAFVNDYPERKLIFMLPASLYLCGFLMRFLSDRLNYDSLRVICVSAAVAALCGFSIYSFNNIYKNPNYLYKTAMQDLKFLGSERVIGGWGYGFRLYNSYRPYLNIYGMIYANPVRYFHMLSEAGGRGDAKFIIEYGDRKTACKLRKVGFVKEKLIFKTNDPVYPDMFLYEFINHPIDAVGKSPC